MEVPRDRLDVARLLIKYSPGADPEISERGGGGGSQILERGGGIRLFSAAFSHFLINLLQIFHQKRSRGPSAPSPKSAPVTSAAGVSVINIMARGKKSKGEKREEGKR